MIKQVTVKGYIEENTYFYIDEKTKHGFIIDPGAESEKLLKIIKENSWIIEKILVTQGHFDHIGAINDIKNKLNIEAFAFSDKYLLSTHYNLSKYWHCDMKVENIKTFKDNEVIALDTNKEFYLKVIHTPGHTEDSCIFYNKEANLAFVGDTIFKDSIGNTCFPGGNLEVLENSIINKIFTLNEETKLYSGHTDVTTVKEEKINVKYKKIF